VAAIIDAEGRRVARVAGLQSILDALARGLDDAAGRLA
jgi:hypothetical protein